MSFTDIENLNDFNNGGLKQIQFIDVREIVSFPACQGTLIEEDIVITQNANPFTIKFITYTASFTEKLTEQKGSLYGYASEINAILPKDRQAILNQLHRMAITRFVVIITDHNGFRKVVGTKEAPVQLVQNTRANRSKFEQRNQYSLKFAGTSKEPVPFIADGIGFTLENFDKLFEDGEEFLFQDGETYEFEA